MVKNCERGLENAAQGRRPRAAFSCLFFMFFSCSELVSQITNGFVYATLVIQYVKYLGNEQVTRIVDKERCIKEQTFFELLYVSCIYFTS